MDDSLCEAEQKPEAQKVCGEEDVEDDAEGETTDPKVCFKGNIMKLLLKLIDESTGGLRHENTN